MESAEHSREWLCHVAWDLARGKRKLENER
jgi:hypothetical protein